MTENITVSRFATIFPCSQLIKVSNNFSVQDQINSPKAGILAPKPENQTDMAQKVS